MNYKPLSGLFYIASVITVVLLSLDSGTACSISLNISVNHACDNSATGCSIAGGNYSLLCVVNVTSCSNSLTVMWINNGVEINSSDTTRIASEIQMNSYVYSSTLMIRPLLATHAGTYTCSAMVDGVMQNITRNVTVQCKCNNMNFS